MTLPACLYRIKQMCGASITKDFHCCVLLCEELCPEGWR